MNWLLKIVDGPMKGAEIELLGGRRTSVGSDDACDLVIADQALAAKAFELDVSDAAVTLIVEGGEAKVLHPFEVRTFGTTSVAIGPAEGAWEPLVYPEQAAPQAETPPAAEEAPAPAAAADAPRPEADADTAPETAPEPAPRKRRRGLGCLFMLVLLGLVVFLVWFFWPRLVEKWPVCETCRVKTVERLTSWWRSGKALVVKSEPVVEKGPTLAEIAAQYGLALTPATAESPRACLSGNVRLRTERLAIRALALADDPSVRFDLTDDESLRTSANELLFVVTEGALQAVAASNRVVTLTGYAPNAAKLEYAVRALSKDVPSVARLDTTQVTVGGTPPKDVAQTAFVAGKTGEKTPAAEALKPATKTRHDYPIAGILTTPYPCVVMRNGLRLCEGAQVGSAVIVAIAADKLVLREGKTEFEWRP